MIAGALVTLKNDTEFKGQLLYALLKAPLTIARSARAGGEAAAEHFLDLARERAPYDTGTLFAGIEWRREGDEIELRASAVRETATGAGADYARFVEYGTAPGQRGTAATRSTRAGFYSADVTLDGQSRGRSALRRRQVYRSHPGTPARPFFFNSAAEALAEYRARAAAEMARALEADGFGA